MTHNYNNILCIEGGWLYNEGQIMGRSNYKQLIKRGWMTVVRRACKGTPALIDFDSMPERFKSLVIAKIGNPHKTSKVDSFKKFISPDNTALEYFSTYKLQNGKNLPVETIQEYSANASLLNALHHVSVNKAAKRKALGGSQKFLWDELALIIEQLKNDYKHSLPTNPRRLKERLKKYRSKSEGGYYSLIHKNYCNNHSRKVSNKIEDLILALFVMPNKPFASNVHDLYLQFLGGAITLVDFNTGELFDREDFINQKTGEPVTLSESTMWNYINLPQNRIIVDKIRNDGHFYNNLHRPHHNRHAPMYALSKISMDDRDLPRKMRDGKRVKAYYSFDIASGCVIGASYSRDKDTALFIDCLRNTFQFIDSHGLGMPMEVEVEHHIVNKYKDGFMMAGALFGFVRWCNAGNSQEKWAETGNRLKKYGDEKQHQEGIGRWTLNEKNRPAQIGEWDEDGMRIKEKLYTFEELVADDRASNIRYNNMEHPKHKGMSRLDVLKQNTNPDLSKIDKALLALYIGEKTPTTIRRNQYVTVQHTKYQLPNLEVLKRLLSNNYNVQAYHLPTADQLINEVYLYQDKTFIAKCEKIKTYSTAKAEQTEEDHKAFNNQTKIVSEFDKTTKEGKNRLAKVTVVANTPELEELVVEVVDVTTETIKPEFDTEFSLEDYKSKAVEDI